MDRVTPAHNPYCAHGFAPGRVPWGAQSGVVLDDVVTQLTRRVGAWQILGPHGSGKTTLLAHLARVALARGCSVERWRGTRRLDTPVHAGGRALSASLVLLDEAEQIPWLRRAGLRLWCTLRRRTLVMTTHSDLGVDVLCTLAVTAPVLDHVLAALWSAQGVVPTRVDSALLLRRHGGNVREILFELYDEHERARRSVPRDRGPSSGHHVTRG